MYPNARRTMRTALSVLFALSAVLLLPQATPAATTQITAGTVDWGIKASFRNYVLVTGHGSITPSGGVTVNPDGTFKFNIASGTYNDVTHETNLSLGGSIHLLSHPNNELDITLSNLRVVIGSTGASLRGDADSRALGSGEMAHFTDIPLVTINADGDGLPLQVGGQTTWPALPTMLTQEGVPVFGNYTFGTVFDPITIDYTGPGGKPIYREFPEPGTPIFAQTAQVTANNAPIRLFHDDLNDVVHVLGKKSILAFEEDTLAFLGVEPAPTGMEFWKSGNAFDPETGTIFTTTADGADVLAYTWDPINASYSSVTLPITANSTLAYSVATDRLFSIGTVDYRSWGYSFTPPAGPIDLEVAELDSPQTWTELTYGSLTTTAKLIGVTASSTGKLVATLGAFNDAGTFRRQPVIALKDDGANLTPEVITGTQSAPDEPFPAEVGTTFGWINGLADNDGGVLITDLMKFGGFNTLMTLDPSGASSGFSEVGTRNKLNFKLGSYAFDRQNDDLYAANLEGIEVLRGGKHYVTIDAGESIGEVAGGNRRVFAIKNGGGPTRLATWTQQGEVPTITANPSDVTAVYVPGTPGTAVTFAAAGKGSPVPTVRWQRRTPGGLWQNIAAGDSDSFTFLAGLADDGVEFRALYSNAAGSQASAPATLQVSEVASTPSMKTSKQAKRLRSLRGGYRAVVATVVCGGAPCRLILPKKVSFTVRGKRFAAAIDGPRSIAAGGSETINATLPRAVVKALKGNRVTLRVRFRIITAERTYIRTAKLRLR